jgi:hypothetical protein
MIKKSFPGMLFLFFLIFFFQSSTYNYETLDWDVNAFLVTSLELGRGNLPFETQYDNKPPLLFAIFYFFTIVANKNLLIIKILNDLIIFLISVQSIYLFKKRGTRPDIFSFVPSVVFILVTSNVWFHPSYSEFISLFCISSSYLIYKRSENRNKFLIIGLLLSASSLINLGTSLFLICFVVILLLYENNKYKKIFNLLIGFGIIHLILLGIYAVNGSLSDYLMAMVQIPLSYGVTEFSLFSSLTIFLTSFIKYNLLIYTLILFSISLSIHIILKMVRENKLMFENSELIFLIFFGLMFFNLAGKGYYHHLIFLLYFLSLSFIFLRDTIINKGIVVFFILVITGFTISEFTEYSLNNIKNFLTLEEEYPIKKVSNEIILHNYKYDEIFSTNHILLLYYLDKPNTSYVVHPALYDYEEITSVLIENNKIKDNEIVFQLDRLPQIYEGNDLETTDNSNYYKIELPEINNSLLNYWTKDNNVFLFIKR